MSHRALPLSSGELGGGADPGSLFSDSGEFFARAEKRDDIDPNQNIEDYNYARWSVNGSFSPSPDWTRGLSPEGIAHGYGYSTGDNFVQFPDGTVYQVHPGTYVEMIPLIIQDSSGEGKYAYVNRDVNSDGSSPGRVYVLHEGQWQQSSISNAKDMNRQGVAILEGSKIWRNGEVIDINDLSSSFGTADGPTIQSLKDINDHGVILARTKSDENCILLPVEVESMDKFLAGSFDESIIETFGGESSFGLEFRNSSSGESYRFNSIADAYVYDNPYADTEEGEDDFLSDKEVAMGASGSDSEGRLSQDVIFYKQDGKLHFRTLFDQAGEIEIAILKDGEEIGAVTHELVEDEDIGELIDTIDAVISDDWAPLVEPPLILPPGSGDDDPPALAGSGEAGTNAVAQRRNYQNRNATTKAVISIWDRVKHHFEDGVRKAGKEVDRYIRTVSLTGKGFIEGAWFGIKDDAQSLLELGEMIANPHETAKSFYEAFKVLITLDLDGWKNVGSSLVESFLSTGREGAGDWVEPDDFDVAAYLTGFTCGYIAEQAVITYITAGGAQALKAGKIGAKLGSLVKVASRGRRPSLDVTPNNAVRVAGQKAKNSIFRRFSQDVGSPEDTHRLKALVDRIYDLCAFGGATN